MNIRIGTAPVSWGVWFPSDPNQPHWHLFLDQAAEAGYEWIELGPAGYMPANPETVKAELSAHGLRACGQVVMRHLEDVSLWPQIEQEARTVCEALASMNARFLILIDDAYTDLNTGEVKIDPELDDAAWHRLVETLVKVASLARDEFGLTMVFHPHADTHVQTEEQIERLLDETDPVDVALCLDTGHHAYCGGDVLDFYERHSDRIGYLHLKNVDAEIRESVARESTPFAKAVGRGVFVEPDRGWVDFDGLIAKLREKDFDGWAVVEQDIYPAPFDKPLPIARRTRAYLREAGFG